MNTYRTSDSIWAAVAADGRVGEKDKCSMKHLLRVALVLLGLVASTPRANADLGIVVASYGNWDVRRSVDTMTDKVTCVATYKGNNGVQLNNDAFYIMVSGGPKGFEYRLNDEPKSDMILVSDILRQVGAIEFKGELFNRLVHAQRLRVQVLTYLDLKDFDLNLSGIFDAYGAVYHCR